ncbi:MAG TPA: SCP2 sterol-binding domain-containing protein [Thermohalobaculum sp.]|nr:SCP2 sterol-binding domain-containing protein [Thermohalobaculum sp.]
MSDNLAAAEAALSEKLEGERLQGSIRFDVADEGVLRVVDGRVTREDGAADATISGSLDTFRAIFEGRLSPMAAYMTGRVRIDGDLGAAMRFGQALG